MLLAQLSRHRGGAVPPAARRWRPCCFGCPPCLVCFVISQRRRAFLLSCVVLSASCAEPARAPGRSPPRARRSGTDPAQLRAAPPAAPHAAPRCGALPSAPACSPTTTAFPQGWSCQEALPRGALQFPVPVPSAPLCTSSTAGGTPDVYSQSLFIICLCGQYVFLYSYIINIQKPRSRYR